MDERLVTLKDTTANPAPLGLLAFGMTTVLLNIHNAGFYTLGAMIMAMGIFYGGAAQIVAGFMEWKKNNTFGTAAFMSYGFFWLTLVTIWLLPRIQSGGEPLAAAPGGAAMTAYLLMWGLLTAAFFVGTLRMNRALQFVFASLTVLFFLLAAATKFESALLHQIAGFEGIICGASAIYTAIAQILNEVYGRTVLPLGALVPRADEAESTVAGYPDAQTA